jgi:hypothetical protein
VVHVGDDARGNLPTHLLSQAMSDLIRKYVLPVAGLASLIYALWPPLEFEYLGVAATLLGIAPLAGGYQQAHDQS